jgi:DNA-directed RNA polymerase subunit RPC12/RpoP
MKLASTSWSCARCGAAFVSTPPEHGLCEQCTGQLESQLTGSSCPACGGPTCTDCGQRMVLFVPVPWPLAACQNTAQEVSGRDSR